MPTGYTAQVQDGTITEFRDFALTCARAFGALIDMRDEPLSAELPDKIKPHTDYNTKALDDATARLGKLRAMTCTQAERAAQKAHATALAAHEEYEAKKRLHRERYETMLLKVTHWTPPSRDHQELKKFMKDQLAESIKFDCYAAGEPPQPMTGAEWLRTEIARAERDVEYHTKAVAEEVERAAGRDGWLRALRKSLEPKNAPITHTAE
jgi:hypothetical protein